MGRWARRACGKQGAVSRARQRAGGRASERACVLGEQVYARQALGAGVGARGAGRERAELAAGARGERGLGVPVRPGWACWLVSWSKLVHCAPGSVLTQFLNPVRLGIFPESLNDTVHCKVNFRKKIKIFLKLNKNQIKSNKIEKIFEKENFQK